MIDADAPDPVYRQVAELIAARIRAGELRGRLPAEREIAQEYGVSYGSLRKAMEVLRGSGLVRTVHGRGTFATPPPPATPAGEDPSGRDISGP